MIWTIPICHTERSDDWVWHFTKNGLFNIKSAYKLFINNSIEASCSSSTAYSVQWWKTLSKFSIPNKIKIFAWKLYHNLLPTNQNIYVRKVQLNPWCVLC